MRRDAIAPVSFCLGFWSFAHNARNLGLAAFTGWSGKGLGSLGHKQTTKIEVGSLTRPDRASISATAVPKCYLCGAPGKPFYHNLKDCMFGDGGLWNFKVCPKVNCGLVWLDPMPTREDIWKAYQEDYYTHKVADETPPANLWSPVRRAYYYVRNGYLARHFGYPLADSSWQKLLGLLVYLHPIRRAVINLSVLGLRAQPGGRLLEVGFGSGEQLAYLRSLGWQAEGVDVDPVAVQQARLRGLEVRLGPLDSQAYPDNHFDAIVMSHVIEHVHDPKEFLRECHRILRPEGSLVMVTPNLEGWGHRFFKSAWVHLDPPRHLYLYTKQSLRALTIKSGFKIISSDTAALGARWNYLSSRSIASTGMISPNPTFPLHVLLQSFLFYWLDWVLLGWQPNLGEELVLVGEK